VKTSNLKVLEKKIMNNGLIVGKAMRRRQAVSGLLISLDGVDGEVSGNPNTRGMMHAGQSTAQTQNMTLYTINEVPAGPKQLMCRTNERGSFLIWFKWNFLGSDGTPNSFTPFYNANAKRVDNGHSQVVARRRERARICNSPQTFEALTGLNNPTEPLGAAGMVVDVASILREFGVNTLPNPILSQSTIETQMMFGICRFEIP